MSRLTMQWGHNAPGIRRKVRLRKRKGAKPASLVKQSIPKAKPKRKKVKRPSAKANPVFMTRIVEVQGTEIVKGCCVSHNDIKAVDDPKAVGKGLPTLVKQAQTAQSILVMGRVARTCRSCRKVVPHTHNLVRDCLGQVQCSECHDKGWDLKVETAYEEKRAAEIRDGVPEELRKAWGL